MEKVSKEIFKEGLEEIKEIETLEKELVKKSKR